MRVLGSLRSCYDCGVRISCTSVLCASFKSRGIKQPSPSSPELIPRYVYRLPNPIWVVSSDYYYLRRVGVHSVLLKSLRPWIHQPASSDSSERFPLHTWHRFRKLDKKFLNGWKGEKFLRLQKSLKKCWTYFYWPMVTHCWSTVKFLKKKGVDFVWNPLRTWWNITIGLVLERVRTEAVHRKVLTIYDIFPLFHPIFRIPRESTRSVEFDERNGETPLIFVDTESIVVSWKKIQYTFSVDMHYYWQNARRHSFCPFLLVQP